MDMLSQYALMHNTLDTHTPTQSIVSAIFFFHTPRTISLTPSTYVSVSLTPLQGHDPGLRAHLTQTHTLRMCPSAG